MDLKVYHEGVWKSYPAKSYGEYTYAWLGEPHESVSVKLDSNSNETTRNVFTHPRDFAITNSDRAAAVDLSTPGRIEVLADNYSNAYAWGINTGINYMGDPDFAEGEYERTYTMSVEVKAHVQHPDGYYSLRFDLRTPSVYYSEGGRVVDTKGEWVRVSTTLTLGADLQGDRSLFNFSRGANHTPGDVIEYRDWKVERGNIATPYFDGDTPPSRAWANFTPRNISGIKRIWPRSVTPPPPGTQYAWLGEPHASESVRWDGEGNETARNLVENPRGHRSAAGWRVQSGGTLSYDAERDMLAFTPDRAGSGAYIPVGEGNNDLLTVVENGGTEPAEVTHRLGAGDNFEHVTIQPGETVTLRNDDVAGNVNFIAVEVREFHEGGVLYFRAMATAPGESDGSYFDGDTLSDRAHDLWYNRDGVPHEWVNGQGWTAISDVAN